jgi:hypothetical protein
VKQIRARLTYANVMSSIAVFLVLGGATALAAGLAKNSVGTKQLKKNAVTTAKIKNGAVTTAKIGNGAVTGAKVDLGSLGTVPNAAHADNATNAANATHAANATNATNAANATNATNANTVGGRTVTKIFAKLAPGTSQTVATFGAYSINVTCSGAGNPEITLAIGSTDGDYEAFGNGIAVGAFFNRAQGPTTSIDLDGGNVRGITTFSAAQSGGFNATGTVGYDDTNTFNEENVCAVYGQVIS